MKYVIEIGLLLISLYASKQAKKQMAKAMAANKYDFGIFKTNPLTGQKAARMATIGLAIAKVGPWVMVLLILIYNILDWIR